MTSRNNQSGIGIGLILMVVAILAFISAAISLSTQSSSNNNQRGQDSVYASMILSQASSIADAYQQLRLARIAPQDISLNDNQVTDTLMGGAAACATNDAAGIVCLFDPTEGVISRPSLPTEIFTTAVNPPNRWLRQALDGVAVRTITIQNVGTAAGGEQLIFLGNLRESLCRMINAQLFSVSITDPLPTVAALYQTFVTLTGAGINFDIVVNGGGYPAVATGYREGCVQLNGPVYVYFRVVESS